MPPMPASVQQQGRRGPTWFDKFKMGALMGGTVGGIMGFVYGTVTIFQYGAGTAGVMRTLSKFMVGSGSMFACVMGIGSIIRTDTDQRMIDVWRAQHYSRAPFLHARTDLPSRKP